ncbi:MAG TPA: alpha/beta hydrolase [Anaerolineae bacterium]|nr:alpha/beta hydrolase [Anaerolineae bacterium]
MNDRSWRRYWLPPAAVALILAVYFLIARRMIGPAAASTLEQVALGVLVVTVLAACLAVLFTLVKLIFTKDRPATAGKLGGRMIVLVSTVLLLTLFVAASQWLAHTPAITGPDGSPLPNSIASLEKVKLGGADQWLIVRGQDVNKPVLLFLSGGPGASEAARVLRFNQELEKDFVVVIWEQRGCGKSYPARDDLTVERYTADVIELAQMLGQRFGQEKIYLVGHSWGTIIGVLAAQARPDLFHAYVGTAQMVNVLETDRLIYDLVLDHSRQHGDTAFVETLATQGPPPYFGRNPILPYAKLFGREYQIFEAPNVKDEAYRRDGDAIMLMLKQPEYGWLDRVYYLLGLMTTFNAVYPQLQEVDFRLDAARLDLPVYIVLGRHDMNNPSPIPEAYFQRLEAPEKALIVFENSGHGMIWEEAGQFHRLMADIALAETARN